MFSPAPLSIQTPAAGVVFTEQQQTDDITPYKTRNDLHQYTYYIQLRNWNHQLSLETLAKILEIYLNVLIIVRKGGALTLLVTGNHVRDAIKFTFNDVAKDNNSFATRGPMFLQLKGFEDHRAGLCNSGYNCNTTMKH